jgi:hypothetical protein
MDLFRMAICHTSGIPRRPREVQRERMPLATAGGEQSMRMVIIAATALTLAACLAAPALAGASDDLKRSEARLRHACLKAHGRWLGITSAGFRCAGPWDTNPRIPDPIYGSGE